MTQDGLNELRELATEADELQRKADELDIRICNLYQYEEDVLDQDAYTMLTKATVSLQKAAWRLGACYRRDAESLRIRKGTDGLLRGTTKQTRQ